MSQDLKVTLRIDGETGKVRAEVKGLEKDLKDTASAGTKAGRETSKGFKEAETSAASLNSRVKSIKSSMLALGAAAVTMKLAKEIIRAGDEYKTLNARIGLVTNNQKEFNNAQRELFAISQETRVALGTTVDLYARLERSLEGQAIAQGDVLNITRAINQSLAVSGATAQETSSVITQLSQGLAAGALRGQEFNAVNESGSRIMSALKDELGKTSGELREMAFAGELTTEVITQALKNQSRAIGEEFDKLPVTVEGALQQIGNANTKYFGELDQSVGITDKLSGSLTYLSENLETVYKAIGTVFEISLLLGGAKGLGLLITRFGSLSAVIGAATARTIALGSAMKAAALANPATLALLGGYAVWKGISSEIENRAERLHELAQVSEEAATAMERFISSASGSGEESESLKTMADQLDVINTKLEELAVKRSAAFAVTEFGQGRMVGGQANQRIADEITGLEKQRQVLESMSQIAPKLKPVYEGINSIGQAWEWLANKGSDIEKMMTGQVEAVDKWIESQEKQLAKLQQQNEYFGKSTEQVLLLEAAKQKEFTTGEKQRKQIDTVTAAVIKETKSLEAKEKALAAQNDAIELAMDLNKEYATDAEQLAQIESARIEAIDLLTDNHKALAAAGIDLSKVIDKVNKRAKEQVTAVSGANDMWDEYYQLMQDLGMIDQVAFEFTQMEMALEELAMSGQFSKAQLDAMREAMYRYREAAEAGTQAQQQFNQTIRGVSADGGFTSDASFNDLINQGMTLGDVLSEAGKGFSQGLEGGFNSMNVLLQGVETIMGVWDSTAGQDSFGRVTNTAADLAASGMFGPIAQAVGQIAQTINSLAGGRLFGTSFETESQRTNLELGQGGFSGTNTLREVRQRSWFRGREWQETVEAIGSDMQASLDAFYNEILQVRQAGADALGVTLNTPIVTGSYVEEYDADGNLTRQGSTFGGRFFNEDSQAFQVRAMAENIIDLLGSAFEPIEREVTRLEPVYDDYGRLIGSFSRTMTIMVNEADQLANRWRHDAQLFLDGSQMLLAAGADILDGNGLFESLTAVANVIQDMAKPGEVMTDAYMRVQSSVLLLDDALDVIGTSFDMARVDYVRFAADITDAAGGIQEAAGLWQNYFENFYSEPELNEIRLGQSSDLLAQQAGNLGLDADMTMAEFRQLFNEQLPNLTAEQIAQWLEFAETLVRVNDLQEERNAALQAEIEALQEYNDFAASITDQIANLTGNGASEFENRIAEIDSGLQSNIDTLNEMAIAAGLAGASEQDLANAHRLAALQTEQAIGILRAATQSLIDELYGDQAQGQVEDFSNQWQSGINNVGAAGSNLFSQWEAALQRIDDYTNSLLTNSALSPLEKPEQLAQAKSDYYDIVAAAKGGDLEAAGQVTQAMQEYLQLLRDVERSGEDYNSEFYAAVAAAQGIEAPSGLSEQQVTVSPSQSYMDFSNGLAQGNAEATALHRLELSQALAEHVADLSAAIKQPVLQLFAEMGGDIHQFLVDLGIDTTAATGETTAMLANLASTLNIQVTELAEHVGLSLGSLADAQSLLNDGLEYTIDKLPQGIQDTLEPLLRDVETAADGTAQETALAALETATAGLPAEYRNALAPYFANIDPTTELAQQVTELKDQTRWLTAIAKNTAEQNNAAGLPSYAVGTPFVPKDQIAQIHKGEMIIPAREAGILRGMGVNVAPQSNKEVVEAIKRLETELQSLKAMQRGKSDEQIQIQGRIAQNTVPQPRQTIVTSRSDRKGVAYG